MTKQFINHIARRRAGASPAQTRLLDVRSTAGHILLKSQIMRTSESRKTKKETSPEVKTRKLKIQPKTRQSVYSHKPHHVPEIKLCGKWLEKLGFEHGSDVLITLQEKRLVIEPVSLG